MQKPVLVVMAAGIGARYGGLKQIDPIGQNGQILLDYSLYDAHRAGFSRVIFIIRPEIAQAFEQGVGARTRRIMQADYAYQTPDALPAGLCVSPAREKPLGTGHAVWCAKPFVGVAPFAVINADDFYGADAFQKIYAWLSTAQDDEKYRWCMVGYRVENTLTENGSVSRGVCTLDTAGCLHSIVERTAIAQDAQGIIRYAADGDAPAGDIAAGTLVSMNLWGFTPSFFQALEQGLAHFITERLPENPLKGEYYLPAAVNEQIIANKCSVSVLATNARWFGVTYRQDKPAVQQAIAQMTMRGEYPTT